MSIETKYTCPFGHSCEKIVDGNIERCVLYLEMKVRNNVTNEESSTFNCSFNWNVLLQHETNTRVFSVQQATENFKNEVVNQQASLSSMFLGLNNDSTNN